MSNNNGVKITSRLSIAQSVISGVTALLICVGLFFFLQGQLGGYNYISQVKGGHPVNYPQISYEEAFNSYYTSPQWTYQDSTDSVVFTGVCQKEGKPVTVELIYKMDKDEDSFSLVGGSVNGTQFSFLTLAEYNNKPFEEYKR